VQGTITRLADITPEERRKVIEDLIGIAEYDLKKSEARVQLRQADMNLRIASARIGDVQERLERLEEERNNALRSRNLRMEVKQLQGILACHRLRHGDAPIPPNNDLSFAANFFYMLFEKEPDPLIEKLLDVIFLLHADHTMNASTFSARVVGSTLANPYTIVSAAIGTLSGPLHGGANEKVVSMLEEIGDPEKVRPVIEQKIKNKEKIMGIGHRVYKTKDPRAVILQEYAHRLFAREDVHEKNLLLCAEELEKIAEEKLAHKKLYPNVDFYSGVVFRAMGIPTELYTPIFAIGRVAGWLAHWKEQLKRNRIFRPTQKYTGESNRTYVPIEERGGTDDCRGCDRS